MSFISEPLHTNLNATTGEDFRAPVCHGDIRSINHNWSQIIWWRICNGTLFMVSILLC